MAYLGEEPTGSTHPFSRITIQFGCKQPPGKPLPPKGSGIITQPEGTVLAPGLVHAYRSTDYQVGHPPRFTLRIGQASPELLAEHEHHRVASSAFITASNPYGKLLSAEANDARFILLNGDLAARGLNADEGYGHDPSGKWPAERSLLVFGIDLDLARAIGGFHNQNAIVWNGEDGVPQLVLLR